MIMCVAAYEMKRLGLAHKPLIIGLKANVHEIADTFRKAYPLTKFSIRAGRFLPLPTGRGLLKIKNNNWDCIMLTQPVRQDTAVRRDHDRYIHGRTCRCGDVTLNFGQSTMRYHGGRCRRVRKRKQNLGAKLQELRMNQ